MSMKKIFILIITILILIINVNAQTVKNRLHTYQNFPLIGNIQFHSLGPPFRKIDQNFLNIGFVLGTEMSLSGTYKWIQQINIGWYNNRNAGNGLMIYTQSIYRPYIIGKFFGEVKAGLGFIKAMHPVDAYIFKNGNWVNIGKQGKNMLMVPFGVSLGYNNYKNNTYCSPFISYQVFVNGLYNKSFPIMINTLIQFGVSVHLKK